LSSIPLRAYRSCFGRAPFAAVLLIAAGGLFAQSSPPPETAPTGQAGSTDQNPAPPAPAETPAKKSSSKQTSSSSSSSSPSSNSHPEASSRRFWFGGIASYTAFKEINGGTTAPAPSTTLAGNSGSKPLGEGIAFHAGLLKSFSLDLDLIHRRAGYNFSDAIVGGTTAGAGTSTTITNITYEITNATYWDVPLLLEYKQRRRWYYEGGGALRHVSDLRSWRFQRASSAVTTTSSGAVTTTNTDTCCNESAAAARHNIEGVVVGAGIHFVDAFGIKVTPEFRYTRWLGNTFAEGPVRSNRNQIEVLFGIAF
jgi:hypothetical protein